MSNKTLPRLNRVCWSLINRQRTLIIQHWWLLITSTLIVISGFRCRYYFNFRIKPNSIDFISNSLAKSDPLITITELVFLSFVLYRRKKLEKVVRTLNCLNCSKIRVERSKIVVCCFNLVMLLAFFKYSLNLWVSDRVFLAMKLDCAVCCLSLTIRTTYLTFVFMTFFIVNSNLDEWMKEFRRLKNRTSKNREKLMTNLDQYNVLSDTFYFLMEISTLHCFYGLLLGLKRIKDALVRDEDDLNGGLVDDIIIFFNFFHLPIILLVCHAGQNFQEKVKVLDTC